MELFIQLILIGRLVILGYKAVDMDNHNAWIAIFSSYLVLTEIVPFVYLVYGMVQRLKVKLKFLSYEYEPK